MRISLPPWARLVIKARSLGLSELKVLALLSPSSALQRSREHISSLPSPCCSPMAAHSPGHSCTLSWQPLVSV